MKTGFIDFIQSSWAIFKKDIVVWSRNRRTILTSIIPVISVMLIQALGSAAVGRSPVALVTLDHGAKGQQLHQIFYQADVFQITDANPQQAQILFKSLQVVAIITIPADFTQHIEAHESSPIDVRVNNLNLDFTNDIRRAVPDVITQFYQAQGQSSPIKITLHEQDLRQRDISLFQYNVLPLMILLLVVTGLVNNGASTAHEWEYRTIKEMLLSPVPRSTLIIGKTMAGFVATFLLGLLVFSLSAALDWTRPTGAYWGTSLLLLALVAFMATGLGVAVGAAFQRMQVVALASVLVAFYLYFLAGGIGVLSFEPIWLQEIANYDPLAYGVHGLQMAVFYHSSDLFVRDVLVLGLSALIAIGLGVLSMRRGIVN